MNVPRVNVTLDAPDFATLQSLSRRGKYKALSKKTHRALKRFPNEALLHGFAGAAQVGLANLPLAIDHYKRAVQLEGSNPSFCRDLANIYFARSNFADAQTYYLKAQTLGEDDADLSYLLGTSLMHNGQNREALVQLSNALTAQSDNAQYAARLGEAFERCALFSEAVQCFEIACYFFPENTDYLLMLARSLYESGDSSKSVEVCERALKIDVGNADVHSVCAAAFASLGREKEAQMAFRAAVEQGLPSPRHLYNFAQRHDMSKEPKITKTIARHLAHARDTKAKRWLHFALAKSKEDVGQYARAYQHLLKANSHQKHILGYDMTVDLQQFAKLKQGFSDAVALAPKAITHDPVPIFIVGMPRSGTTLVESILAQHRDVTAAGELNALQQAIVISEVPHFSAPGQDATKLGQSYFGRLPAYARQAKVFTDKMPLNFRLIGHILTSMPNARIIHTCRDPRAVCWANFRTNFTSYSLGFGSDPEDLVAYFRAYQDLMQFWHLQFPGRIYNLDYEALVHAPEPQIRNLLSHVGLEWQQSCLEPESATHTVTTASQMQVRQKIYTGSSQTWRKYQAQAGDWLARVK